MLERINLLVAWFGEDIVDDIYDSVIEGLQNFFFGLVFSIDQLAMKVLDIMYQTFAVFVGTQQVTYKNQAEYLIDIFFSNSTISGVYIAMEVIGIMMAFIFAIISVIRKIFDTGEKVRMTIGQIIGNLCKSIFFIICMNFFILIVLSSTNLLMDRITYAFDHGDSFSHPSEKTFSADQYATMATVLDTIGNFSLNPDYDSTYNINSCFNNIRANMLKLQSADIFDYSYRDYDIIDGKVVYSENTTPTWQYVLTNIARVQNLDADVNIDGENKELKEAILAAMKAIKSTSNFKPLQSYTEPKTTIQSSNIQMSTIVFLSATMDSARNNHYDYSPSFSDPLRSDYINGLKDVYDWDTVKNDFNMYNLGNHILIIIVALVTAYEFLILAINAVARIFNMLLLYLAFPPIASTMALDDGGKLKQWLTAFIVQSFSVFGTLIAIRLLMLTIPIIFNSELVMFDNSLFNAWAKLVFLVAVSFTVEKAGGVITGILADQAGFQSVQAGNTGSSAAGSMVSGAAKLGGKAASIGGKIASPITNGLGSIADHTGLSSLGSSLKEGLGINRMSNWVSRNFGSQSGNYSEKKAARKKFEADLSGQNGDQAKQAAREKFSTMSGTDASREFGMSKSKYKDYKAMVAKDNAGSSAEQKKAATPPAQKK